jgi:hypothetical protein
MLHILGSVLFAAVGVLAAVMADKGLRADRLLSFHQAGTGRQWTDLSPGEQAVGLALTRTVGLGFTTAALGLLGATVAAFLDAPQIAVPLAGVGLVFCFGLALINRALTKATSVNTPWRGALIAAVLIAIGIGAISI